MSRPPLDPHERARADQMSAAVDDLITEAREHRRSECVYPQLPCIGDWLLNDLERLPHHTLVVLTAWCMARLADLPAPAPIEGIERL